MFFDTFWLLLKVLSILNIFFAILIVVYERKNPATTWAWLMVLMFLPYAGFMVYLFLGLNANKHKIFQDKAKGDSSVLRSVVKHSQSSLEEHIEPSFLDLVSFNTTGGNAPLSDAESVVLFHEGNSMFSSLLDNIANANDYIYMQYYIFNNDKLGASIVDALAKKAREGVEVKLLIDGMGCMSTPMSFFKPLTDAGGKLSVFMKRGLVRINFRNHRKICVIDGNLGYVGGLNVGDEYLGKSKRFGYWRDSHILLKGNVVSYLELRFIMDWNFASDDKIEVKELRNSEPSKNPIPLQVVSSGPDTKWDIIHNGYIKLIYEANESIYIQTPYFVPDDSMFEALKIAALAGIDVRVIFPAHPDHPFVYWAALSYFGELLNAGVKCYAYEKGFIHSKLLMIDGKVCSIGTANMDVRSFKLNFEVNAVIYDEETTKAFENEFIKDLEFCTQMTEEIYAKRSVWTKIREAVSRLLSPLL